MKIKYSIDSFGITHKSLKVLRNTLAMSIGDDIAVAEIRTSDSCCGFLIVNKTRDEVTFTGDGFRTDDGGEGGAGYRSAQALLSLFGLSFFDIYPMEPVNTEICQGNIENVKSKLLDRANELKKIAQYHCLIERRPQYVRG